MESWARRPSSVSPPRRRARAHRRCRRSGHSHVVYPRRAHKGCQAARPAGAGVATAARPRVVAEIGMDSHARPPRVGAEPPPAKPDRAPTMTLPRPPAVGRPVTPAQPPAAPGSAGLTLEALIYSDLPAERMIFVKGRKYVEGDMIEDRVRVEEI